MRSDARCWQSFIILCDDGNGDGCGCFKPLYTFNIHYNLRSLLHKSVPNSLEPLGLVLAIAEPKYQNKLSVTIPFHYFVRASSLILLYSFVVVVVLVGRGNDSLFASNSSLSFPCNPSIGVLHLCVYYWQKYIKYTNIPSAADVDCSDLNRVWYALLLSTVKQNITNSLIFSIHFLSRHCA